MNWHGIELCCPSCRGDLVEDGVRDRELRCQSCDARYPVILGIPDLRIFDDPYVSREADRAKGRGLAERFDDLDFAGLVEHYYEATTVVTRAQAKAFAAGLLAAEARARAALETWEGPPPPRRDETLLEIGCGTAPLLIAARQRYAGIVGTDIAFRWLVVGRKRLDEAGVDVPLVCACAEALPFVAGQAHVVAGDAVIENVREQAAVVAEAHRVLRPGGRLYLTTTNRHSLGPDPQTGIWAVGWRSPAAVRARVERAGGLPPRRELLSAGELRRLLTGAGFADVQLALPTFPEEQRVQFAPPLRAIASAYNLTTRVPLVRQALFAVGPKLVVTGSKPAAT